MVSFRKAETASTVVYTGWNLRESDTKDSFRPLRISARTVLDEGGDIGCAILPAWIEVPND
jgi:hypothetical protein